MAIRFSELYVFSVFVAAYQLVYFCVTSVSRLLCISADLFSITVTSSMLQNLLLMTLSH